MLTLIWLGIFIVLFVILWYKNTSPFSKDDEKFAHNLLEALEKNIDKVATITDDELLRLKDDIMMVKDENGDFLSDGKNIREGMSFFNPINYRYWPYYYYSFPYQSNKVPAWPPGLFSRLYYWEPGFSTGTGQSYWMRPGISNTAMQRGAWVRKDAGSTYYYLNNGTNRTDDYYNT
jgi:hypothetical protein